MNYIKIGFIISFIMCFLLSILMSLYLQTLLKKNTKINISAYYNTGEYFAGFVEHQDGLIRACEFSVNGEYLSCSKWFDNKSLKQGKNQGVNSIKFKLQALPKI